VKKLKVKTHKIVDQELVAINITPPLKYKVSYYLVHLISGVTVASRLRNTICVLVQPANHLLVCGE
jgi:hypothetical protein